MYCPSLLKPQSEPVPSTICYIILFSNIWKWDFARGSVGGILYFAIIFRCVDLTPDCASIPRTKGRNLSVISRVGFVSVKHFCTGIYLLWSISGISWLFCWNKMTLNQQKLLNRAWVLGRYHKSTKQKDKSDNVVWQSLVVPGFFTILALWCDLLGIRKSIFYPFL